MPGAKILFHIIRSLIKYWGVTLLNIAGFAIATTAALVIALYVRNELTFDRFIQDADSVALVSTVYSPPASPVVSNEKSPAGLATWLRTDAPAVEAATRLHPVEWSMRTARKQSLEYFYWADPSLFQVLQVRAMAGDLKTALQKPYTMVLTRRMAERYFGRDDVIGQTAFINGASPVTITAVLEDFPANSSLGREIFVSSLSDYSMLAVLDQHPIWQWASSYTFLRLKPGMHLTDEEVMRIAVRHWRGDSNLPMQFRVTPLKDVHFQPEAESQMTPRGHLDTVFVMIALAGFIQLLAAVNLAGLMTAQIDERSSEMAIRRSLGAKRPDLIAQILLEATVVVVLAVFTGLMLAERLLPTINAMLRLQLSLWRAPFFLAGCLLACAVAGIAASLHPAMVLSSARGLARDGALPSGIRRIGWLVAQFALLITLLICSQVVYRQWAFATGAALNFDADHVVQIDMYTHGDQNEAFRRDVLKINGVREAAYSRFIPDDRDVRPAWSVSPSGRRIQFNRQSVDVNFFHMFGVRLLAGKNFTDVYAFNRPPTEIILSRSAAEALGFHDPGDAVGRMVNYEADHLDITSRIVGVVSDMRISTIRGDQQPMIFDNQSAFFTRLNVKLTPQNESATLAAIDETWKRDFPQANPINRHFYSEYLDELYHDMVQQWWTFGLLSVVGMCLSVLGLTGLSMYLARSQAREIAIRIALGARTRDIFLMRLTPFLMPLALANLVAGALSWLLMSLWLNAFKAHVSLDALSFIMAGALTVAITVITLTAHGLMNASSRASIHL